MRAYNDGVTLVTLNLLAKAQALISGADRILPYTISLLSYHSPFNELTRARLLLRLEIGAGGLKKG
ncbi:hypothetical protein CC78DRAFT_536945 [Lojkania enalia]|uniref:Uncharacterized protein n=1 Tax=Lojkania enalia TaxID=147567 RepID=A0A9P4K1L3_9PLEO|nr:hypothetical protein CC78DRAFT_536945 [Didymosphaeria enalia]